MTSKIDRSFIAVKDVGRGEGWLRSLREVNVARKLIGYALDDLVLKKTPLRNVEPSMLFTYMHRRFGLGNLAADRFKLLGAGWRLTTPHPKLVLFVTPSFSAPGFSFMPYVAAETELEPLEWLTEEIVAEMAAAYRRTLLDLLRPVCERDVYFNALGPITQENRAPAWTQPKNDAERETFPRYHENSGVPMPDGVFGTENWHRLLGLLNVKGGGDTAAGIQSMIDGAEDAAFEELFAESEKLHPVVGALLWSAGSSDAKCLVDRIGLDEAGVGRMGELFRVVGNPWVQEPSEWLLSLAADDVRRCGEIVERFGLFGEVDKCVANLLVVQCFAVEWKLMAELFGENYDDDFVDDDRFPTKTTISSFRDRVAEAGLKSVVEWYDRLGASSTGETVRWMAVASLWSSRNARLRDEQAAKAADK
ncbi:hypothetical protein [Rhizobium leguminosarum]|uniref:hypothetical protein n=1 Tax=Rhizobium leguminosarum TaxID=384 RepID=UPI002E1472E2|nr:hypothetical protein U8Q02_41760 [Rhizobium leguminosarum]